LTVAQWLFNKFPALADSLGVAKDLAIQSGHRNILRWIYHELKFAIALVDVYVACRGGSLEVTRWLATCCESQPPSGRASPLSTAVSWDRLEVAKWWVIYFKPSASDLREIILEVTNEKSTMHKITHCTQPANATLDWLIHEAEKEYPPS